MQPRRVLILTPSFSGFDGISTVAREAARALEDPRWELRTWSLTDREVSGGRGAAGRRWRLVGWAVAEAARPGASDLLVLALHVHLAVAALPLRARGARLALFLHGIEAWGPLSAARRLAVRRAHPLVANSSYTAERFARRHPGLGEAPRICHLGLGPAAADATTPTTPGLVLSVGRLVAAERYKGTDALLAAWPEVVQRVPGARLVVVGEGDDRGRLQAEALRLGLEGRVRFEGRVDAATLGALFSGCDLFALPSTGEGFGLVYLEAMRAGVCVLAGPGAPEEVVEHGRSGVVVDPSDRALLARTIADLLLDDDRRRRLAARGHERWRERFTADAFGRRLREALALPAQQGP